MNTIICLDCNNPLSENIIKHRRKRCLECVINKRLKHLASEEHLSKSFSKTWTKHIYMNYKNYLNEFNYNKETKIKYLSSATKLFAEAEQYLSTEKKITHLWLDKLEIKLAKSFKFNIKNFLLTEGVLSKDYEDENLKNLIRIRISKVSENFNRLLEIYINEKFSLRDRQIELMANKPLSLRTVESNINTYIRLVKWIVHEHQDITAWDMLQEEHVNKFLLTLKTNNREIVRKDLTVLFKLAFKKRIITHVPIMDLPSREYPRVQQSLSLKEQKKIAKKIQKYRNIEPTMCLITTFCFFYGLSTKHIINIKIEDIDLERKCIHLKSRPPIYLTTEDLILLENYTKVRSTIKNINKISFLIVAKSNSYQDASVSSLFISKNVKRLTGFTPRELRITCFSANTAMYGSQFLIDAFGLSLTQSSRYGKMEDYLLHEEITQQKEAFINLNQNLNKNK